MANSTWVHPTPQRATSRMLTPTPASPRRRGNSSSHAAGTPTDRSAPRVMSPDIPAAGSRMAICMRPKRRKINGLSAVQPPGTGVEEHYALVRLDRAPGLELQRSGERGPTLRRRVDTLQGLEVPRPRGEPPVRPADRPATAFPHRPEHQPVPPR